jgi:hypothetical protein
VPAERGVLRQIDAGLDALLIEEAQFHAVGELGEQ